MLNTQSELNYGCNNVTIKNRFVTVTICCVLFSFHSCNYWVQRRGSFSLVFHLCICNNMKQGTKKALLIET